MEGIVLSAHVFYSLMATSSHDVFAVCLGCCVLGGRLLPCCARHWMLEHLAIPMISYLVSVFAFGQLAC